MKKAVFFDVDGTLWDQKMRIPASTRNAIHSLRQNGHLAFVCTGRSMGNLNSAELRSLGFDGYVAACGAHIEISGEPVYTYRIPGETLQLVLEITASCKMPVVLEGPVYHWISKWGFDNDHYIDYLFGSMGEGARYLTDYDPSMFVNKFSADVLACTDYDRIRAVLGNDFDFIEHGKLSQSDTVDRNDPLCVLDIIEAVPKGLSKATGMKWVADHLGLAPCDIFAFGDSANDLEMLKAAGTGIAMGGSRPNVCAAADYVTSALHENGIFNGLRHFDLI